MGSIAFYTSFIFFTYAGALNSRFILELITSNSGKPIIIFAVGLFIGYLIGKFVIVSDLAVFSHELKHWILARLVGNKYKGLKIRNEHGHFEYSYTKATAKYNAFIMLAPYWLPLFVILGILPILIIGNQSHLLAVLLLGSCWGIDLTHVHKDMGPHQTDLSELRGGYTFGLSYSIIMNIFIFSLLFPYVLTKLEGYKYLFIRHYEIIRMIADKAF